ncbi:MAG: pyruvate formate lyase family protein, partial [Polyangia bacterium]|nr:pyruvate formate lyase family protein [Polyangia bacterium]
MVAARHRLTEVKDRALDRITPQLALGALEAMALSLRLNPSFRRAVRVQHPSGARAELKASFLFTTWRDEQAVHAIFDGKRMRVGSGSIEQPDVTARFRDLGSMRAFFKPGADPFGMLLSNRLKFEGNLSLLARFGYLSSLVQQRGAPRPARVAPQGPARWRDLSVPPPGQPCSLEAAGETSALGDDPYLARFTLDDFPTLKRQLWVHRTANPGICAERPRLLTEFKLSAGPRPQGPGANARYQARALHYLLTRKQPIIHDDDLLAGTTTRERVGVVLYPETHGTTIWPELLTVQARELNPYRISREDARLLGEEIFPFWERDNIREHARAQNHNPLAMRLDERWVLYFLWKNAAVSHTIADLPAVLGRGLLAMQEDARAREAASADPDQRAFYEALGLAMAGVVDYSRRLASHARSLAALPCSTPGQDERCQALREIARICERVPAEPAETLHEAVQAVWLVFLSLHQESTNAGLSIGRLDVWLQPYFEADLAKLRDGEARERYLKRAIELSGALMLKCTDHLPLVPDVGNRLFGGSSSDQVITLGGLTTSGESAVCDMTWIFLKAVEMLRLRDPNLNARYAPGVNSEAYLRRLCELNLLTRATPSIHNDDAVVRSLVQRGFSPEHARDWSATGCVEPTSCGRHMGHTNCMMFNLVAPLEMVLGDGFHPILGEQVGPRTGDPRTFATIEDLFAAYEEQLAFLLDQAMRGNDLLGRAHQDLKPTPLLSALMQGPLESGRDVIRGGARYNSSGTAMVALTDVVDSLAAVKVLVYDKRLVAWEELLSALEADFVGHEPLLGLIARHAPRFGSEHPLPGKLARRIMERLDALHSARTNYRGGPYVAGYWSMSNHVAFGVLSGALPSGRRRGEAFTPGLTPSPRSGAPLTEQIRAVAELDPLLVPNNIAFNVKVVPGPRDGHQQILDRLQAYVQSYCDLGGM